MPALDQIRHLVVVMLENRSFDNLLGGLYPAEPPNALPAHLISLPGDNAVFYGLNFDKNGRTPIEPPVYSNPLSGEGERQVQQSLENDFTSPNPDPGEEFEHITTQIFGSPTQVDEAHNLMQGFIQDYSTIPNTTPADIMRF